MPLKYIENTLMEEKIVREKFGYKNHFDSTIKDFLLARSKRNGKLDHQLTSQKKKLFTDATSFDILKQPSYYEKFNYTIPAERKPHEHNYDECDEIRRVLDFPYYNGERHIDDLFQYRRPGSIPKKIYETGRIPGIKPKRDYTGDIEPGED